MKYLIYSYCLLVGSASAQITAYSDSIVMKNETLEIHQTLNGSGITALLLEDNPVNPLDWRLPVAEQPRINAPGYDFRGHFISVGTWGMPTEGEQRSGLHLYGDANADRWKRLRSTDTDSLYCSLLLESTAERLSVRREIWLDREAPVLKVTEHVTNHLPIGRPYNFLQHATFGGKFVDRHLLINTNADRGFYQKGQYPRQDYQRLEESAFAWPHGKFPDGMIDLRKTDVKPKTYLTSHVFSDTLDYGWAVAVNPQQRLLVGYLWSLADYPWLNVWHQYKQGNIRGRAIEFATCGLGLSFQELMENNYRFYDRLSFEFIDAQETISKSYYLFACEVPKNFRSLKEIRKTKGFVELIVETSDQTISQKMKLSSLH